MRKDQYFKAFSTMLKGAALKLYYTSIKPNPLITTIKGLCENIRETFEGNEYKRSMLTKWNNTSLKSIMEKNPEKDVELCLQLLIEDLRTTQMALQSNFRDDTSFQNKLMTACQAHPACSIACSIPASSSVALINNLRSSISTYLAVENDKNQFQINNTIGNLVDNSDKNEQYFIDRQYYSDLSNRRNKSSNSRQRTPVKRCFICQKSGCWSSRHSAIERYNKNFKRVAERRYDQFLVEFEGKSDYDDDNNDTEIETLITDINKFEISDSEAFITEVGTINLTEASKLITKLSDRSAVHALLRKNDYIEEHRIMTPKLKSSFIVSDRYGPSKFHGIMIDTGAAGKSTAGYNQYLAYCQLFSSIPINESEKGSVNATFGIGSTTSIGSIIIGTPIGECEFHILKTNTPFLLSLNDMDKRGIILDNLRNILVTNNGGSIRIVRKFGHPFMM
ncbi:hypothetical protein EV44_g3858 [Erysiphe necator]|uniref:Uncharacterized protein n=1 Tax=Uncinula necator TaxID=52586 RepID=A0A0B1P5N9_UNCNE|nr:hypothetical protein EV44_g3858 [Erysiphe necator]